MASSTRRPLKLVLFAIFAGGWVVAAYFLWRTEVPSDLKLRGVDLRSLFSPHQLHDAERFSLVDSLLSLGGIILLVVVLGLYARYGHRFMKESAAGPIGTGMMLAMLGLALVWLAMLPIGLLQTWWWGRHGLIEADYVGWISGSWGALGGEFLFICLTILIVMGFARLVGASWWLIGAPVFVGIVTLFTFAQPYMTPLEPLKNPVLVAASDRIARDEGVEGVPVKVVNMATYTTAPNAEAMGLGPSRRVVLWDTMLDGRFSNPAVETVIAHEYAHQRQNHLWKMIAWFALFTIAIAYLIARLTRGRGGMAVPAAVPLFLFVWIVFPLVTQPLNMAFSRRMEAEADWIALQTTRDPGAAKQLFEGFVKTTDSDPSPPVWSTLLFDSHPTLEDRIAMVDAWQARNGG